MNVSKLIPKRGEYVGEFMFARAAYGVDLEKQGEILTQLAALIDAGRIAVPRVSVLPWSAESLQKAHEQQEAGQVVGKLVMSREAVECCSPAA